MGRRQGGARTEPLLPQLRAARAAGAAGPAAAAAAALRRGGRGEGAAGPAGSQVPPGGGRSRRLPSRAAHARADVSPAHRQRAELEELRQQLEESSAAEGRALRAEFEKGREEQERRHQVGVPPSPPLPAPALWGAPVLGVAAPLQTLHLGRAGGGVVACSHGAARPPDGDEGPEGAAGGRTTDVGGQLRQEGGAVWEAASSLLPSTPGLETGHVWVPLPWPPCGHGPALHGVSARGLVVVFLPAL